MRRLEIKRHRKGKEREEKRGGPQPLQGWGIQQPGPRPFPNRLYSQRGQVREPSFQPQGSGKQTKVQRKGRGRAAGMGALLGPLGSKGGQGRGKERRDGLGLSTWSSKPCKEDGSFPGTRSGWAAHRCCTAILSERPRPGGVLRPNSARARSFKGLPPSVRFYGAWQSSKSEAV